MNKSDSIQNLAVALAKFQGEMGAVKFDAMNPFLKNKYATLGAIIETAKPLLAKHGLAVSQMPMSGKDKIGVTTILLHESGEWIENTVALATGAEKGKSEAQLAGSIITYLRRYSLAGALGIYSDEDTDGNEPVKSSPKQTEVQRRQEQELSSRPTNSAQVASSQMTLEQAEDMTTSEGKRYGDMETKALTAMLNAMNNKQRGELSNKEQTEIITKMEAAQMILRARAEAGNGA